MNQLVPVSGYESGSSTPTSGPSPTPESLLALSRKVSLQPTR